MFPQSFDASAHAARRARLAQKLNGQPALFASGRALPRNYAGNTFPFRASSHFLYFFGVAHPSSYGLYDGKTWTLFVPDPAPDDALWEGAVPSLSEIEARAGLSVRGTSGLPDALKGLGALALPTVDLESSEALGKLLGRSVRPGTLSDADGKLADAVIDLRLHHDEAAVREMQAAADITVEMYRAGMKATRAGIREAEVAAAMVAVSNARNVELAYPPIVTVHGEVLHNHSYAHLLGAKDMVLADVGAESAGGWASDVTRTWPVSGRFSTTQRELYEVVLRAQVATVAAVKPGVRHRDLHLLAAREIARGLVDLGILKGNVDELVADGVVYLLFPHGIGHLIGLDVHDMEDLGDRAGYAPGRTRSTQFGISYLRLDRDLEPGMAVTIEPGVYIVPAILADPALSKLAGDRLDRARLARFADVRGIRIEDDVVVTATGHDVLTRSIPKSVRDVEAALLAQP